MAPYRLKSRSCLPRIQWTCTKTHSRSTLEARRRIRNSHWQLSNGGTKPKAHLSVSLISVKRTYKVKWTFVGRWPLTQVAAAWTASHPKIWRSRLHNKTNQGPITLLARCTSKCRTSFRLIAAFITIRVLNRHPQTPTQRWTRTTCKICAMSAWLTDLTTSRISYATWRILIVDRTWTFTGMRKKNIGNGRYQLVAVRSRSRAKTSKCWSRILKWAIRMCLIVISQS